MILTNSFYERGLNRQDVQPRRVKEILDEIFLCDEPFAAGYRQFLVEQNRKAPWEPAGLVGKKVEVRD